MRSQRGASLRTGGPSSRSSTKLWSVCRQTRQLCLRGAGEGEGGGGTQAHVRHSWRRTSGLPPPPRSSLRSLGRGGEAEGPVPLVFAEAGQMY